jgi:hypothetical protein
LIFEHAILHLGGIPSCETVQLFYTFYLQEKRIATVEELTSYHNMMNELNNDPDQFQQKYKHKIPTPNLHCLESKTMSKQLYETQKPVCGICQDEIHIHQTYFELSCSHLFHHQDNQCLENATILNWLKENKTCPLCKQEVIIISESEDDIFPKRNIYDNIMNLE